MVGCTLAAAASLIGGLLLIWLFGHVVIVVGGPVRLPSLFGTLLFGLLLGCLLWIRVGVLRGNLGYGRSMTIGCSL